MEIPILIEPMNGRGYRARSGEPMPLSAEGETREGAVRSLQQLIEERLKNGAELASLQVSHTKHPWINLPPIFRENDPLVQEWKEIMEENRARAETDPNYL